jgi:hypothetical protein
MGIELSFTTMELLPSCAFLIKELGDLFCSAREILVVMGFIGAHFYSVHIILVVNGPD